MSFNIILEISKKKKKKRGFLMHSSSDFFSKALQFWQYVLKIGNLTAKILFYFEMHKPLKFLKNICHHNC